MKIAGRFGAIGIELVLATILGYFGGSYLDGKLGTGPWLTWIGFGIGLAAGFRSLFRLAKIAQRLAIEADRPRTDEPPQPTGPSPSTRQRDPIPGPTEKTEETLKDDERSEER